MSDMITKTYCLDEDRKTIHGFIYEKEAMKQAIKNILYTQRYAFEIYSYNYGSEISKMIGTNLGDTETIIEKHIEDALLADERISSIENIEVEKNGRNFEIKFNAVTAEGLIGMETEV
ncbi:MAG: DUF2634 domain-containing protein [Clostridia bacterium]|jgi:phage baseplate assembly protein W|nr:DUF2634 domain-containing protein [Clostridia bacterium]